MRAALTAQEYSNYVVQANAPTSEIDFLKVDGRPDELTEYIARLKLADFTNARAERASLSKTKRKINGMSAARYLSHKSDDAYEHACDYLDEQLSMLTPHRANIVLAWLDRPFDYTAGGKISIDCVGVARVLGSKSVYCRVSAATLKQDRQQHRNACAKITLIHAARALIYEPEQADEAQTQKLKALMAKL
jgi:hypothetical protein